MTPLGNRLGRCHSGRIPRSRHVARRPSVRRRCRGHRRAYRRVIDRTGPSGRTYSAYRFDASGNRIGPRTSTFARDSSAPFNRRAVIEGRTYVRITVGSFAGLWVPSAALRLDLSTAEHH